MAFTIDKKPTLVRNGIVQQLKQAANSLTIQEWNQVVNTLKTQANVTVEYIEKLHRVMFGSWSSETTGVYELFNEGVIFHLLNIIENAQELGTLKTNFYGKADQDITAGDFVMFGGVQGDHILFKKADINAEGFINEWIMGVAESNMTQGVFGNVRWFGQVANLSLDVPAGTLLWVGSTPGAYTTTKPVSGPRILMAVVEKQRTGNASNGIMLVRPTLSGAGELDVDNATDADFLRFDLATGHYKNIKANKVVASAEAPNDNKAHDIWFDLSNGDFIVVNPPLPAPEIVYNTISGGNFTSTSFTNTLSGGTFNETPANIITGGNF
jgi:hypothetical protein